MKLYMIRIQRCKNKNLLENLEYVEEFEETVQTDKHYDCMSVADGPN